MNNKITTLLIVAGMFAASCDVFDHKPQQSLDSGTVFNTEIGANGALNGVYNSFETSIEEHYLYNELASDNANHTGSFPTWTEVDQWNMIQNNVTTSNMWNALYVIINNANNVIAYTPPIEDAGFTDEEKNDIIGQAKFLRAWAYSIIVNYWGPAPLKLEPTVGVVTDLPRTSVADIYAAIDQDLTDAFDEIATAHVIASGNATKHAALALRARTRLQAGRFADAATDANEVITATTDISVPAVTYGSNGETLFELKFNTEDTNGMAFFALPNGFGGRREYGPTPDFVTAFDPADVRLPVLVTTVGGLLVLNRYNDFNGAEAIPVVQMGEMHLVLAEGLARSGGNLATAAAQVDAIRTRAGLAASGLTAASGAPAILTEIAAQRRLELSQLGHRWFDIQRFDLGSSVISEVNIAWQDFKYLWPIPQREIETNDGIAQTDQNAGY